jgi:hypothetical protein
MKSRTITNIPKTHLANERRIAAIVPDTDKVATFQTAIRELFPE